MESCQHVYEDVIKELVCIFCDHRVYKKCNFKQFVYIFGPNQKSVELGKFLPCLEWNKKINTQTNRHRGVLTFRDDFDELEFECENIFEAPSGGQNFATSKLLSTLVKSIVEREDQSFSIDDFINRPYNVVFVCASHKDMNHDDLILDSENGLLTKFLEYLRGQISKVRKHKSKFVIEFGFCSLPVNSSSVFDLLETSEESTSEERNPDTLSLTVLDDGFRDFSLDFQKLLKSPLKYISLNRENDNSMFNTFATFVIKRFSSSKRECILTNRFYFVNLKYFSRKEGREIYGVDDNFLKKSDSGNYGNRSSRRSSRRSTLGNKRTLNKSTLSTYRSSFDLLFKNSILSYLVKKKILNKKTFLINLGIVSNDKNSAKETKKILEFMKYSKEESKTLIDYYS